MTEQSPIQRDNYLLKHVLAISNNDKDTQSVRSSLNLFCLTLSTLLDSRPPHLLVPPAELGRQETGVVLLVLLPQPGVGAVPGEGEAGPVLQADG